MALWKLDEFPNSRNGLEKSLAKLAEAAHMAPPSVKETERPDYRSGVSAFYLLLLLKKYSKGESSVPIPKWHAEADLVPRDGKSVLILGVRAHSLSAGPNPYKWTTHVENLLQENFIHSILIDNLRNAFKLNRQHGVEHRDFFADAKGLLQRLS